MAETFGDAEPYWSFLQKLLQGVASHNEETVAEMVHYPIYIDGHPNGEILSEAEFVQEYDRIFTIDLTRLVLKTPNNALFISWRGIGYGNGELWINGYYENCDCLPCPNKHLRIAVFAINPGLYEHVGAQPGQAVFEGQPCDEPVGSGEQN